MTNVTEFQYHRAAEQLKQAKIAKATKLSKPDQERYADLFDQDQQQYRPTLKIGSKDILHVRQDSIVFSYNLQVALPVSKQDRQQGI